MSNFTNMGDNYGQQAGKVYGGMHQHTYYQGAAPPPTGPVYSPYAPARPDDPLVGRDALLEDVRQRFCAAQEQPVRLALEGMPGAGKSRLALELFYDAAVREHFAGGILWARLGQQPNLEQVLRTWEDTLGGQPDPRMSLEERATHVAALVGRNAKPWLWIIDDVWSTEDAAEATGSCRIKTRLHVVIVAQFPSRRSALICHIYCSVTTATAGT